MRGACLPSLRRRDRTGLAGDAAVMLDAAVALEIEDRLFPEHGRIEIAIGNDELVVLCRGLRGDLAVPGHDDAARDQRGAVFGAPLRHPGPPRRGLVGAGPDPPAGWHNTV